MNTGQETLCAEDVMGMLPESDDASEDFDPAAEGMLGSDTEEEADELPESPCEPSPKKKAALPVASPPSEPDEFDPRKVVVSEGKGGTLKIVVDGVLSFDGKKTAARKHLWDLSGCAAKEFKKRYADKIEGHALLNNAPRAAAAAVVPSPAKKRPAESAPAPVTPKKTKSATPAAVGDDVRSWPLERILAFAKTQAERAGPSEELLDAAKTIAVGPDKIVANKKLLVQLMARREAVEKSLADKTTTGRKAAGVAFAELAKTMEALDKADLPADTFCAQLDSGAIDLDDLIESCGSSICDSDVARLCEIDEIVSELLTVVRKALRK
jgi:hypothetical protein